MIYGLCALVLKWEGVLKLKLAATLISASALSFALAGCGATSPLSRSSQNTSSTSTATAKSVSTSTTAVPIPTSTPVGAVSGVPCTVEYGVPQAATSTTDFGSSPYASGGGIPQGLRSQVSIYTMDGKLGLLAPKGWSCKGIVGADGGQSMTVTGPNAQAVKLVLPNGQGPSISLACNYFASAQTLSPCNSYYSPTHIVGETVRRLSGEEVQIVDLSHLRGGGQLSGGQYVDQGVILWVAGSNLTGPGAKGNQGYALQVDCAMPTSQSSLCQAILNFVTFWYANPSNVGF